MSAAEIIYKEFQAIDENNPAQLKEFFLKYKHLKVHDLAVLLKIASFKVRTLKYRAGLRKQYPPTHKTPVSYVTKTPVPEKLPDNWDTKEWFEEQHKKHGLRVLARITGLPLSTLRYRLKKWNIQGRPNRPSTHPCCNKEWIHENYILKKLTVFECAKLAGVSHDTMARWVAKMGLSSRPAPIWYRILHSALENEPAVAKVEIVLDKYLQATYTDGKRERYRHFKQKMPRLNNYYLTENSAKITKRLPIRKQYQTDLSEEEIEALSYHRIVPRKEYDNASKMEQRIVLHRIHKLALDLKEYPDHYPKTVLAKDLEIVKSIPLETQYSPKGLRYYAKKPASWRRITEHYFRSHQDISAYYWLAVSDTVEVTKRRISIENIRRLATYRAGIRTASPQTYAAIFKRLNAETVIDLHPDRGQKALACALAGIHYIAPRTEILQQAIDLGFIGLTGLSYEELKPDSSADLIISDRNFECFDISGAKQYIKSCKKLIAYCTTADQEAAMAYKPKAKVALLRRVGKIKGRPYFLIW